MNTQRISLDFPADILLALNETENQLVQRIKLALAVQLYETALTEHNISVSNLTADEVMDDIGKLQ